MRKLASIQTIAKITPIPKADFIELATVLGWNVVVGKGQFKPGDLCVYLEIDSLLPDKPEFENMRKHQFRVRTITLKNQLSQGLCYHPLDVLPPGEYQPGDDVTELLGIKKFERELPPELIGKAKGGFPGYIAKTSEDRIQSVPAVLAEMRGMPCYITVKIDGTSATFGYFQGELDVCSHDLSLLETPESFYWKVFRRYGLESVLKSHGNLAIQGEIAGPNIEDNNLRLSDYDLFIFNVYDIQKGKFFDYPDFIAFCRQHHLQTVPVQAENVIFDFTVEQLLQMAKGKYASGRKREGIVIRPMREIQSEVLRGRLSIKVINNEILI